MKNRKTRHAVVEASDRSVHLRTGESTMTQCGKIARQTAKTTSHQRDVTCPDCKKAMARRRSSLGEAAIYASDDDVDAITGSEVARNSARSALGIEDVEDSIFDTSKSGWGKIRSDGTEIRTHGQPDLRSCTQ
jgi:hypothetical protein